MLQLSYHKLGQHRGAKRLWLQGLKLEHAGYTPGARYRMRVDREAGVVTLTLEATGDRVVSQKKQHARIQPVIDINSRDFANLFGDHERVRVVIKSRTIQVSLHPAEAAQEERLKRINAKLAAGEPLDLGVVCHGLGVMDHAIHQGLNDEGIPTHLAWAIEMEPKYLQASMDNNRIWRGRSTAVLARAEEVEPELLAKIEVLAASLPCTGASKAGKAKNKNTLTEGHETAGTAYIAFLAIVRAVNPAAIVFENVTEYSASASYHTLCAMLRQWGYEAHETVLDETLGALERRKRMCTVFVTAGMDFRWALEPVRQREARLAEILDEVPLDSPAWKECAYLDVKRTRDAANGHRFLPQVLTPDATFIGVIGRGYWKWRGTEPMIQHPTNPKLRRLLTPAEHARAKAIPEHLVAGLSSTVAHECLGQSVLHCAFVAVGRLLAKCLKGEFLPITSRPALQPQMVMPL